ncbi:MAG TPA: hypothetical protein DCX41_00555 [Aequorivita sp.]|nr:hypothetical protein [Aequorivita sp.]MBF30832.1 hypothetical protein [Aequorivita sp.]HAV53414.1 hypothetical protein [Aequorivita sp.]HBL79702.1 hypothetical protein [Aequorivita sp.]|tara:strand:- start:46680 stop:48482 length:1803 start_codon:yes stop_codon:yes gene_type:complete
MQITSPHTFHIPVMGIAYTIDSPIKVACFGINSAISVIEDNILEVMRKYYYGQNNEPYVPITVKEEDYRARRITDYLNLMQRIVTSKMEQLKASTFEAGSDLVKYFEMLPDTSLIKDKYHEWLFTLNPEKKGLLEKLLLKLVVPGAVEVNIMTKVDKENLDKNKDIIENGSDALTALKGYAKSELTNSSLIFSAGMNPRLYNYMENFSAFDAYEWGCFHKKVVIKVSDYRSALIQGKYLAKKGIWVSEFRIESGLNCGGHVFATQGLLMGPILQEFKEKRQELQDSLFELYNPALTAKGKLTFSEPHPIKITVQGGIGTSEEDNLLRNYYQVDGTGWGTPFLLCREATTVDEDTLELLRQSKERDVARSKASPLGVQFNYLRGTTAEKERLDRIAKEKPGSPCTEKLLVSNTEFTKEPICTASSKYQKLKLEQLETLNLSEEELNQQREEVLGKECLCIGLSNAAAIRYEVPFLKKLTAVTICPGPNIVNFSKVASLREMTDHIYGRQNIMQHPTRPLMFVAELRLYIDFLMKEMKHTLTPTARDFKTWKKFSENLLDGIAHYYDLVANYILDNKAQFERDLADAKKEILQLQELQLQVG